MAPIQYHPRILSRAHCIFHFSFKTRTISPPFGLSFSPSLRLADNSNKLSLSFPSYNSLLSNRHGSAHHLLQSYPFFHSKRLYSSDSKKFGYSSLSPFSSNSSDQGKHKSGASMQSYKDGAARGPLIVFEGLDRSGKSTQCSLLHSHLFQKGLAVEKWRFPDRTTEIGKMISAYLTNTKELSDEAIHLLFSANRFEKTQEMEKLITSGCILLIDRYCYSGAAFSAAKGLPLQWCKNSDEGLPAPDLVIYIDLPPECAVERGGYGSERYESLPFQKIVQENFFKLKDEAWKVINGKLTEEEIHSEIVQLVSEIVDKFQSGDIPTLKRMWM